MEKERSYILNMSLQLDTRLEMAHFCYICRGIHARYLKGKESARGLANVEPCFWSFSSVIVQRRRGYRVETGRGAEEALTEVKSVCPCGLRVGNERIILPPWYQMVPYLVPWLLIRMDAHALGDFYERIRREPK